MSETITLPAKAAAHRRAVWRRCLLHALVLSTLCCLSVGLLATAIAYAQDWIHDYCTATTPLALAIGQQSPDFTLRDPDGRPFHLHDWIGRCPVVIELSSFT